MLSYASIEDKVLKGLFELGVCKSEKEFSVFNALYFFEFGEGERECGEDHELAMQDFIVLSFVSNFKFACNQFDSLL